jgi:hypothetical protein
LNVLNNSIHSAHCRACKERVRDILAGIYGECRVNHQFAWPAQPNHYANTLVGKALDSIYNALGDWRGHRGFAKSAQVPPCDFYVSDPPFILEFDESQHFSAARLLTLRLYPAAMRRGFSLRRWQNLCREINAIDDEPVDRDERRAWYDTLRDLAPIAHGFEPTVRLYAGDCAWCRLDAANSGHLDTFKKFLPFAKRPSGLP